MGAARPPCGLGYLAQSLLENGIEYAVEDLRGSHHLSALEASIRRFQPDLIGVSLVSYGFKRSYALIRRIKADYPQAAIVVGGPHVTVMGQTVLRECPEIDYGVVRDGEEVLVRLCQGAASERTPGLLYRLGDAVVSGGEPQAIADLDRIPFPRYVHFDLRRYAPEIPLITSRGCPYRCTFCPNSLMRRQFIARSAANVVDEIEYWYGRGIRQFNVDDDNFTLVKERVSAICDDIERRGLRGLFIRCANGVRADRVDRALLVRMREVGFSEVGIAADGGNDRVLMQLAKKGETIEAVERAIQDALAVGMKVKFFTILGHPGETMNDIEDSFALAQRYPFLRAQLYNPIPYPGTELFEWIRSHNAFLMPPEEYLNQVQDNEGITPVFETPELPAAVRRKILMRARRIERSVTRRATERMFRRLPVIGRIAAWGFATPLGQWMFFNNRIVRAVVDRIWYRKALVSETPGASERPSSASIEQSDAGRKLQGRVPPQTEDKGNHA